MSTDSSPRTIYRVAAAVAVVIALLLVPTPLLPPHRAAEAIQALVGVGWKAAYLVAAVGLQFIFFCSIGALSAFALPRASTRRGRLIQLLTFPVIIVIIGMIIRAVKLGHLPVWINTVIPIAACLFGVWLGLGLLYQRGKIMLVVLVSITAAAFWFLSGRGTNAELSGATETHLRKLVAASTEIPPGEARFGSLLQAAFAAEQESENTNSVQNNRAAILALGIALGDERLAKFVGLNREHELLRQAALLRNGTSLRGRNDWTRHFCLSAALAVLEHPLVSDAGGLMKEQLDALTRGSGFSFCDFAADRAGVRFAVAATHTEEDANAMKALLRREFDVDNFFPPVSDLPENLTTEQFRSTYGAVGSQAYRQKVKDIESRLDSCAALSPLHSN